MGLALTVVCVGLLGCPVEYEDYIGIYAMTGPPPSQVATIRSGPDTAEIEIGQGVALGFRCLDSCDGSCEGVSFEVDGSRAEILPAYVQRSASSAWVLVGKNPGSATVTVRSACATAVYSLVVRPAPE